MFRKLGTVSVIVAASASPIFADFSYQETTKITGGALVSAMKVVGVFSKQARQANQPIETSVSVKGDRMVRRSPTHVSIVDLAAETITSIDLEKKTYTVMTFEQMKQMLARMQQAMQQKQPDGSQADIQFKVSMDPTGKTKQISGFDAKEMIVRMEMQGTDQKTGRSGSMVVAADTWIAPTIPGYGEVRDFNRRMAEKLNWSPSGNMFMSRPEVSRGMAEVAKESAKLDGMPVFQTTVMGPEGTMPVDGTEAKPAAQQQSGDKPSVGSALGSALGGKFGLGRRKQDTQQTPPPSNNNNSAQGALLEMTTEMTGFSANSVDDAQFQVPAGFQKVEFDPNRGMQ